MEMLGIRSHSTCRGVGLIDGVKMEWLVSRGSNVFPSEYNGNQLKEYSDNHQRLCFTLALWNGKDDILKERLFGLTGDQG